MLTRRVRPSALPVRRGGVLQGCLIAGGVVLVIIIALVIWVAVSWKGWMADALKAVAADAVQQSTLPEDQKTRITTRINTLADDFKGGKVSMEQLGKVMEQIVESPLLPLGLVYGAQQKYVNPSSLPAEEKEAGIRALQRFARGVAEKTIARDRIEVVSGPISVIDPGGRRRLKDAVTDTDLREFFALAKSEADGASVPNEPYTVDIADELGKAIDKALMSGPTN